MSSEKYFIINSLKKGGSTHGKGNGERGSRRRSGRGNGRKGNGRKGNGGKGNGERGSQRRVGRGNGRKKNGDNEEKAAPVISSNREQRLAAAFGIQSHEEPSMGRPIPKPVKSRRSRQGLAEAKATNEKPASMLLPKKLPPKPRQSRQVLAEAKVANKKPASMLLPKKLPPKPRQSKQRPAEEKAANEAPAAMMLREELATLLLPEELATMQLPEDLNAMLLPEKVDPKPEGIEVNWDLYDLSGKKNVGNLSTSLQENLKKKKTDGIGKGNVMYLGRRPDDPNDPYYLVPEWPEGTDMRGREGHQWSVFYVDESNLKQKQIMNTLKNFAQASGVAIHEQGKGVWGTSGAVKSGDTKEKLRHIQLLKRALEKKQREKNKLEKEDPKILELLAEIERLSFEEHVARRNSVKLFSKPYPLPDGSSKQAKTQKGKHHTQRKSFLNRSQQFKPNTESAIQEWHGHAGQAYKISKERYNQASKNAKEAAAKPTIAALQSTIATLEQERDKLEQERDEYFQQMQQMQAQMNQMHQQMQNMSQSSSTMMCPNQNLSEDDLGEDP